MSYTRTGVTETVSVCLLVWLLAPGLLLLAWLLQFVYWSTPVHYQVLPGHPHLESLPFPGIEVGGEAPRLHPLKGEWGN